MTETSDAMTLEPHVFERAPAAIARSVKRSAERSHRRKAEPFRSAMSMLTFYVNRAGKNLSARDRARLEAAKDELRKLFHRPVRNQAPSAKRATRRRPHRAGARSKSPRRRAAH